MVDVQGTWFGGQGLFRDQGITEAIRGALGLNTSGEVTSLTNNPAVIQQNKLQTGQINTDSITTDYSKLLSNNNGQVKSATTTNTGGGGNGGGGTPPPADQGFVNVGTIKNGQRWTGVQWEPLGGSNGANDANAQLLAEIDQAFGGGVDVLNQQATDITAQGPIDEANLIAGVGLQSDKATAEGTQLTADTGVQETKQNNLIQNAFEGAVRAYNALKQQGMARYGLGSSTGGAVGELAAQEYYRQQGGLSQQKVEVGQGFVNEYNKIKAWTKGKIDELDHYKTVAIDALKTDLKNRLNNIAIAKSDLNVNKGQMRLQAMQDTIASARDVAAQDKQFRQTIATNAINNAQTVLGRAFTPTETKAMLNDYGVSFGNLGNTSSAQTAATDYSGYNYQTGNNVKRNSFGQLIDPQTGEVIA